MLKATLLLAGYLSILATTAFAASFNCRYAKLPVEVAICH